MVEAFVFSVVIDEDRYVGERQRRGGDGTGESDCVLLLKQKKGK